jgi:hypothetical protein
MRRILTPLIILGLLFTACEKGGEANLRIYLTDAPAEFQEVNVEIVQVRLKYESDSNAFVDLNTNAGIYDLLTLQNGVDTTIVDDMVPAGVIKEIRLILGDENTVLVDSTEHDLDTPSAHSSGYKIKLTEPVEADMLEEITIDFDAEESIRVQGNGRYKLQPVLKVL